MALPTILFGPATVSKAGTVWRYAPLWFRSIPSENVISRLSILPAAHITDGADNNHIIQAVISLSWNHLGFERPSLEYTTLCAVLCVNFIGCLYSYCKITLCFLIFFVYLFSCFCLFVFCLVYHVFWYSFAHFSFCIYSCLFAVFAQVDRPLPAGGNPTAVNKCHIIRYC